MNYPWGHSRRFNSYTQYFRNKYQRRIQKISLDAGMSCPNRSGPDRTGGCTFCNNRAFNPSYCQPEKSITQQIQEGIEFHAWRYRRAVDYLAYFQAYTNTFAPLGELQSIYEEALTHPQVAGLVIGTRPDCLTDDLLIYLKSLIDKGKIILIEFGIESVYDQSLIRVHRGHLFEATVKAIHQTKAMGIPTGGHLIIGLPGESRNDILASASILSDLPLDHVKFHQLQLMKGTRMIRDYKDNPQDFYFFPLDEYIDLMVDYIELLRPDLVLERFASEIPPEFNLSPVIWDIRYDEFLRRFEQRLEARNTWQGRLYNKDF